MAYMWNQTVIDTTNNMLTNPDFSNMVKYNFQLQICRNITKPMDPGSCNVTSPVYMVRPLHVTCRLLMVSKLSTCASDIPVNASYCCTN